MPAGEGEGSVKKPAGGSKKASGSSAKKSVPLKSREEAVAAAAAAVENAQPLPLELGHGLRVSKCVPRLLLQSASGPLCLA